MARKSGDGWLRRKKYADGETWLFCYQTVRVADNKRVENSKRVGLVADFPNERKAWGEVGRLELKKFIDNPIGSRPKFRTLVDHFLVHDIEKVNSVHKRAGETPECLRHNFDTHILPRWGDVAVEDIKAPDIEGWFEYLSESLAWTQSRS